MKTLSEHIRHVKSKPHHIRKRVAFSAAMTGTVAIALVWLVGSLSTGAFALKGTSFADGAAGASVVVTSSDTSGAAQGLAGAAAAADASGPARITIVDANAQATTSGPTAEQTTIPF